MVIFATVGYGDNYAHRNREYFFFMISELCGISLFSILMKMAQEFMKEEQRDSIAEKLENFEVWMLSLHRYARRDKVNGKMSYDFK